jgi:hypothetical protein
MSFLAPLWLAGLAALLLPIALHLLGRGRPPRVALGSVRLLTGGAVRVPRRARLQRPWLLALRCLLLAALAVALAGPRLRGQPGTAEEPLAWVMLDPGLPAAAVTAALAASETDSGEGTMVTARWLAPGLPPVASPAAGADLPDPAAVAGGTWSLVAEAAAMAPAGASLRVVGTGRLAALRGDRPRIGREVTWEVVPDDRPNHWPVGVAGDGAERHALVASSDRQRTRLRALPLGEGSVALGSTAAMASGAASDAPPTAVVSGGALRLAGGDAVADDDLLPLPAANPVRRVAVLAAPGRAADAGYLAAGLRAAAAQAGLPLELTRTMPPEPTVELVFWLDEAPPPPALLAAVRAGATLVRDAAEPAEECSGSLRLAAASPVRWQRCAGGAVAASARVLWHSDGGRPLLVSEPLGEGRVLRLAGRFHPGWSTLVLSPAFPEWLLTLLAADVAATTAETAASDRRGDGGQGAPAVTGDDDDGTASPPGPERRPGYPAPAGSRIPSPDSPRPERLLWAALPMMLLVERWLARRSR